MCSIASSDFESNHPDKRSKASKGTAHSEAVRSARAIFRKEHAHRHFYLRLSCADPRRVAADLRDPARQRRHAILDRLLLQGESLASDNEPTHQHATQHTHTHARARTHTRAHTRTVGVVSGKILPSIR